MIETHNHNGIRPVRDLVMELVETVNKLERASMVSPVAVADEAAKQSTLKSLDAAIRSAKQA